MAKRKSTKAKSTKGTKRTAPPQRASVNGRKTKAKTQSLPGMEDHAIRELENVANEYVEIRDARMELTKREHDLKAEAMKAMRRHGKTFYKHGGVTIQIVSGEDDIKVRVAKANDDDEENPPAGDGVEFSEERREAVDGDDPSEPAEPGDEAQE